MTGDDDDDDDDDFEASSEHMFELQAGTFRSYIAHINKCISLWARVGSGSLDRNLDGSDRCGWIRIYMNWIGAFRDV